jgi:hypothetical protein
MQNENFHVLPKEKLLILHIPVKMINVSYSHLFLFTTNKKMLKISLVSSPHIFSLMFSENRLIWASSSKDR